MSVHNSRGPPRGPLRSHGRFLTTLICTKLFLLIAAAALLFGRPARAAKASEKKKILSFGGNGMIGSSTLSRLIEDASYDITLVSRGTWPFDTATLIQPHVSSVICDRDNTLKSCPDFMKVINTIDEFYAVLDFSGFEPQWVQDAVDVLKDKVRVYIYISTDSVYEVSEGAQKDIASNQRGELTTKMRETQAVRPADKFLQYRLNQIDAYGHQKLAGEEVLQAQKNIPYVSLRFADVIGPRDGTERWMVYHFWVKYFKAMDIPLTIPDDVANMTTSITFVEDAAASIIAAMETKEAWNDAYNIACEEGFNVVAGILIMADIFGVDSVDVKPVPADESFAVYPSVRRGPVDITRAKEVLKFKPTPIKEVLKKTVEWYEEVFEKDETLREYMLEEFIADVLLDSEEEDAIEGLLEAVAEELGVDYGFDPDGSDL